MRINPLCDFQRSGTSSDDANNIAPRASEHARTHVRARARVPPFAEGAAPAARLARSARATTFARQSESRHEKNIVVSARCATKS
jgi:hypothetical protein